VHVVVVCCVFCLSLCLSVLTFGTSPFPRLPASIAIWSLLHSLLLLLYFAVSYIIIIFYPRQSLFSAHTHTTHNSMFCHMQFVVPYIRLLNRVWNYGKVCFFLNINHQLWSGRWVNGQITGSNRVADQKFGTPPGLTTGQ